MNEANKASLLKKFKKEYGEPGTELNYENPFQLLISVMLSAQSTDKKVNEITPALFRKFPDSQRLAKARLDVLESLIRQINYHKTKARHLKMTAQILNDQFEGSIPSTHEELTSLPGVGNKTANVILSELGIAYAFPVDTHVFRVARRLGLASATTRDKVELELCKEFPEESWRELHHWLIYHGRRVCGARSPKCEGGCVVSDICLKRL